VDKGKMLPDQLESALTTIAEFDGLENPPQHYITKSNPAIINSPEDLQNS
jgi:hypothetical protein